MKMSISPKERNILIGFFGILIAVAAWFAYVSPTRDEIEAVKLENVSLKATADEYESINLRVNDYEEAIKADVIIAEEITSRFPAEVKTQDQMMFWADFDKEDMENLRFGDLEIDDRDPVAVTGVEDLGGANINVADDGSITIADAQVEDITAKYVLYGAPFGMGFACTYDGLKSMVKYVNDQYDRNCILGFDVAYDETSGLLEGSISVELFYIEGLEKDYQASFIPSVPVGQADVFHMGQRQLAKEAKEKENQ